MKIKTDIILCMYNIQ